MLESAREEAEMLLAEARREAAEITLRAEAEGRADGAAALAAHAIALRSRELREAERRLDELVDLARALAERLLGAELALMPERIVQLAKQALAEARGARQITIEAHPNDVEILRTNVELFGVEADAVKLLANPSRAPGNLRMVTEVGVLEASLAPQLEHLALKLRETLSS
jgi:flagellar biosynthesis/type III secretory pathway protein FliH